MLDQFECGIGHANDGNDRKLAHYPPLKIIETESVGGVEDVGHTREFRGPSSDPVSSFVMT
ncbi:MAG TPA: hypothetical protein VE422_02610 [Terriglobia bacterium]|jgi:hypothetical protein|nr:hypothetical protein [Terriglobia bacterium]